MYKRLIVIMISVGCLVNLCGCGLIRQRQIESELKELNSQKLSSAQRLESIKQKITTLQNQSAKLAADLNAIRNQTMALLRENPGTVACIASGAVALSNSNFFSDDVKELGATVGLICLGFYIFSEDFQRSADTLVGELNKASDRAKNLQAQINLLKPKIDEENRSWQAEKKSFDGLTEKITALELELDKLR